MQERNFEKQVRDKMEELSLVPSESVWQKVEQQIRKKKERRKVVLWLFTFLLLPAGFLVWQIRESSHKRDIAYNHRPARPASLTKDHQTEIKEPSTQIKEQPTVITEQPAETKNQLSGTKKPDAEIKNSPEALKEQHTVKSDQSLVKTGQPGETRSPSSGISKQPAEIKDRPTTNHTATVAIPLQSRQTGKSYTGKTAPVNKNPLIKKLNRQQSLWAGNKPGKNFPLPSGKNVAVKKMKAVPGQDLSENKTGAEDLVHAASAPSGPLRARLGPVELLKAEKRTVSEELTARVPQPSIEPVPALTIKKDKKWQWSVQASAGISGIHKDAAKPHEQDAMFPLTQIVSGSAAAPPPSRIENDFSVSGGFRVARKLTGRLSVTAALQYHFYSTRIRVGHTVYNDTLLYSSSGGAFRLGNYYLNNQPVNNYHSRYHFVELPLGVEYRLLQKMPLFGHAGVNIAQLTSTNALFYHDQAGIYFTGKSLFRKTQASAFGELTYRVAKMGKASIVTGPHGQYALTGLMNKNVNGKQHLFFAGWNTRIFF